MTVISFRRRLEALEGLTVPKAGSPQRSPLSTLIQGLIAYRLGKVGEAAPGESIAEGMARGLGYEKGPDLRQALSAAAGTPDRGELDARWRDAVDRLLALRGVSPDCGEPIAMTTMAALFRDLPDYLRAQPFAGRCERLFEVEAA